MDKTLRSLDRILSVVGVTIYSKKNFESRPWLMWQTFNFFIGLLTFIFTTAFVFVSYSDLAARIEGACIWTTGVIMSISLGVCLVFRKKLREFLIEMGIQDAMLEMPFISRVMDLEADGKLKELKHMVANSQEAILKYTRIILIVYATCVWLVATLYLCDPIYKMSVREDPDLRLLGFDMWFPWSLKNFKVYIASFIFHTYAGYLCVIAYPGFQATIILLVGQIIRQLKILTFIMQHLDELVMETVYFRDERWQCCCSALLSQCVIHYVKIKRFSNRLNVICRPFYLTLILVAVMLVCVCSVKIAISNKFSETIKYYIHEFCYTLIVLMFCILGQQVENECERLENAVTEKFYIYNKQHKMNVMIFKMALSQHMPINIFGTVTLSLPTFTWFLKTGMSFFTMMMSVFEEK